MLEISICMGSSCFTRGNNENLELIEEFIAHHNCQATIDLSGARCEGACQKGPNIRINGKLHHNIDGGTLLDILKEHLNDPKGISDE